MSISLQKGQKISLAKESGDKLTNITVGLGWDEVKRKGGFFSKPAPIDCDASVLMLVNGKFTRKEDVIYFGNLRHPSGAVSHMGDNLTGAGDGDDEQIKIDLDRIPSDIDRVVFVVNIYDCINRKQHFGLIQNAFIRVVDDSTNKEFCKFNLTDDYANRTSLLVGEIYRNNGEWKFSSLGQGTNEPGLSEILRSFS